MRKPGHTIRQRSLSFEIHMKLTVSKGLKITTPVTITKELGGEPTGTSQVFLQLLIVCMRNCEPGARGRVTPGQVHLVGKIK